MKISAIQLEVDDFLRGLGGSFLFGLPLLMTMEVWWLGEHLSPLRSLIFLAVAFVINIALAHVIGFREDNNRSLLKSVEQAIDTLAIGAVAAFWILLALNRISANDSFNSIIGQVALEAVPLSIGAAVARGVFSKDGRMGMRTNSRRASGNFVLDTVAGASGALFLSFSIAPTEEVPMLAAGLSYWHALVLITSTLLISYIIVFASGLKKHGKRGKLGAFQHPFSETVWAYFIALIVSALILLIFGQIDISDPLFTSLQKIIVLALPASIGAAAGRMVV